jgi:hypothetical protein
LVSEFMYESAGLGKIALSFFLQMCKSSGLKIIPQTYLMYYSVFYKKCQVINKG